MKILHKQGWHIALLAVLLAAMGVAIRTDPEILSGQLWGIGSLWWLYLAILVPIVHQVYVLIAWRLELHHQVLSRRFGKRGFALYKAGFAILILLRPVTLVLLAASNTGTLPMNAVAAYGLSVLLLLPAVYLFYSLRKYFGIDRAFGIDHFEPEKYRDVPMVRKGIFKYTSNGMYLFGFMVLWVPGLLLFSKAALLAALFNHLYIWVHYYFTEKPDMEAIYGSRPAE